MPFDHDLMRLLLLHIEQAEESLFASSITIDGYDSGQIAHHCTILLGGGIIDGKDASTMGDPDVLIRHITYDGIALLEAVRTPKIWRRIKDLSKKTGVTLSLSSIKALSAAVIKDMLS